MDGREDTRSRGRAYVVAGILIVEDHRLFADAILGVLRLHRYQVLGTAATGTAAVETAGRHHPDLGLVDLELSENGLQVGHRIREVSPATRLVAIAGHEDAAPSDAVVRSGFHGYLTKDAQLSALLDAIDTVLEGGVVHPVRRRRAAGQTRRPSSEAERLARQLTRRELQVLEMLSRGAGSGEIAGRLGLAPNTVRTHVQSILSKLQVHSRVQAAAFALHHDVVRR